MTMLVIYFLGREGEAYWTGRMLKGITSQARH